MTNTSDAPKVTVRSYQVGFGDCFLLTFDYGKQKRYALIDFGTNGTPDGNDKEQMLRIAKDIQRTCGSKLNVVVATHRHRDHISGFSTDGKNSPGNIIKACQPDVVIQPWTEDLNTKVDADEATQTSVSNFGATLVSMQGFANRSLAEAETLRQFATVGVDALSFDGQNNLPNVSSVENLRSMGKKNFYVNCGLPLDLSDVLPGVKVWVLGPPTLKQSEKIKTQEGSNPSEFWLQQANFWKLAAHHHSAGSPLFRGVVHHNKYPLATRWFVQKAANVRTDELFGLVRILDKQLNNTSVILLLEVNGKRLLFPGDAQFENWSYALSQSQYADLLRSVDLYKVGHHASRNATPKSLWNLFTHKSTATSTTRLKTMVSTMAGKDGKTADTQIPREPLIKELTAESDFFTTQALSGDVFFHDEAV